MKVSDYIQQTLDLYKSTPNMLGGERAIDYYQWQRDVVKDVQIVPYSEIEIAHLIDDEVNMGLRIKQNECYSNSWHMLMQIPELRYVEGIMLLFGAVRVEHAWSSLNDVHFDLTAEIAQDKQRKDESFGQLISLDKKEALRFANDLNSSGPFLVAYYHKHVLKKWDKKTIRTVKLLSSM